jgi:hypothetical protein
MTKQWANFCKPYSLPVILLGAFLVVNTVGLVFGIYLYCQPSTKTAASPEGSKPVAPVPPPRTPSAIDLDKLEIDYENLKLLMVSAEQRMDSLQKLLGVLVATGNCCRPQHLFKS